MHWLRTLASERAGDQPHLQDDLVQEAAIAIWSVLQKRPDAPRPYLVATAKNAMANLLRGGHTTGAPSRQGRKDASSAQDYAEPPDHPSPESEDWSHVRAAVRSLPLDERQILWDKFWCDRTWAQVAHDHGTRENRLIWRWTNHIKPKLEAAL